MAKANCDPKKMFEPAFFGPLEVKNRLVMSPMGTRMASEIGGVTERQIAYYVERARGGVGLITTEVTCVDQPLGVSGPTNLTLHDNGYIGGHNELVEAVHAHGARIICQLMHAGRQTRTASIKGLQPVAPSAIPCKFLNVMPRALAIGEIEEIVQKFIDAAQRVKTAGYDGVELHGAHGYLIAQFLSPVSNQRTDRYGGDLERRMNFPLEIVRGIRKAVGPHFPISFRLSADEFLEGGVTLEESRKIAPRLEEAGVHVLSVTAGAFDTMPKMIESMSYEEGWKIYLAEEIKKTVKIPVIGVGAIRTPAVAEKIFREGRVDFLALGRALVADPYWPNKAKEGRADDIVKCLSCNTGCIGGRVFRDLHLRCAVNPVAGREREFGTLLPADKKKKVLIVGGGPAGMEAARVARARGHRVTLAEKSAKLGGQLRLAAVPPGKDKIKGYYEYLIRQMKKLKVKVQLKQEVTLAYVQKLKPDVVIVATGAKPWVPDIPGSQSRKTVKAWDILEGKKKIEASTVVVAGGGTVGCETALFLASQNRKVIVAEMLGDLALDMEPINRMDLLVHLQEAGIEVRLEKKMKEITEKGVVFSDPGGREEFIPADWVVLALGARPDHALCAKLAGKVPELHVIGDSGKVGKIIDATYDGFRVARLI